MLRTKKEPNSTHVQCWSIPSRQHFFFSIEFQFKVLISFFEVEFRAWLTSIGLQKCREFKKEKGKRMKMESWYQTRKSNQVKYKRTLRVVTGSGLPDCKIKDFKPGLWSLMRIWASVFRDSCFELRLWLRFREILACFWLRTPLWLPNPARN